MSYSGNFYSHAGNITESKHSSDTALLTTNSFLSGNQINGCYSFNDGKISTHTFNNEVRSPYCNLVTTLRPKCVIYMSNTKNISSKISSSVVFDFWSYYTAASNVPSIAQNIMNGTTSVFSFYSLSNGSSANVNCLNSSFYTQSYVLKD